MNEKPIWVEEVLAQLDKMNSILLELVRQRTVKDYYDTEEMARIVGKAEFTVREWCRNGRIHAEKKGSGRGKYQSWVVSHEELLRYHRQGLLRPQ